MPDRFDHVFHSGAIDRFFNYRLERLACRTLDFEQLVVPGIAATRLDPAATTCDGDKHPAVPARALFCSASDTAATGLPVAQCASSLSWITPG